MGCEKLSHQLLDLGFFSALGTTEHPGLRPVGVVVHRGEPNRYDANNGMTVVYDEEGRPWIIPSERARAMGDKFVDLFSRYFLKRGAHVPHSNDAGHFMDELPRL